MRFRVLLAAAVGAVGATMWMALCYWISSLPVVSPVSLSLAFTPWWRHWQIAVGFFAACWLTGCVLELRAAFFEAQSSDSGRLRTRSHCRRVFTKN